MKRLIDHVLSSLTAAGVIAGLQLLLEKEVLGGIFAGQIVAPYDFFTTQAYDFFAKIRYFADPALFWMPPLPDHFLATAAQSEQTLIVELLAPVLAVAACGGLLVGLLGGLVAGRRTPRLRAYVAVWAAIGLLIHAAAALPALSLTDNLSLHHLIYRARSLVIDGTVAAAIVWALSTLVAFVFAPLVEKNAALRNVAVAGLLAAALMTGSSAQAQKDPQVLAPFTVDPKAAAPAGRMNVVLISLDSLRADHVGCYGYERNTTPNVDALASQGVRFANAVSTSSWTLPTHLTIMTSRYQVSHGVVEDTHSLGSGTPTLAEILHANGYATAGFVSAPYVAARYGHARGMDTFVDLSESYEHRRQARSAIVAPEITEHAVSWLEANHDQRFFLFLHYFDIHYDYVPPPPFDTFFDPEYKGKMTGEDFIERKDVNPDMDPRDLDHIVALYDGEIRFTDAYVGLVLKKIEELGLLDNTMIVLLSDHGDEFFEHGNKGHHRTLYSEVLDVPFLIRLPGGAHGGEVVKQQVSLVDVMPTILGLTGVAGPPDMDGVNVIDFLDSAAAPQRDAVYSEFYDKRGFNVQVARQTPRAKTIQHFNRIMHPRRSPFEYYELGDDPREQKDLHASRQSEVSEQLDLTADWLERSWRIHRELDRRSGGASHIDLDQDTIERLKSLGYTGE